MSCCPLEHNSWTYSRVQIAQGVNITPVLRWMLVSLLEATMIVLDDGIKQIGEHGISLRIWCIDTNSRVVVLKTCTRQMEKCNQ